MTVLTLLDAALLLIILICAFDALRTSSIKREPVRSVAFTLICIGSFGWIRHDFEGAPVQWWAIALHGGFAIYAVWLFVLRNPKVIRRGHITRRAV
jgi:hypothetical protein